MSTNYIQILELASRLSREECILLIKDISTALVEDRTTLSIPPDTEARMLESALLTRAKVRAGEMKTWSLEEVKVNTPVFSENER